jgi:hypothetical protein
MGPRPPVAADAGATTLTGEFPSHLVCGAAFEAVGKNRCRQHGWMCNERVDVVGLAVELDQFGIEVGAHSAHGGFGEGEQWIGEHPAPVGGYEHQVGVQQRHAVSLSLSLSGRGCQWAPLRLRCG